MKHKCVGFFCLASAYFCALNAHAGEVVRLEASDLPPEAACQAHPAPNPAYAVADGPYAQPQEVARQAARTLGPAEAAYVATATQTYGRLRPDLRDAAQNADPMETLLHAAAYEYARLTPGFRNSRWEAPAHYADRAKAFADLSVTGRSSFEALQSMGLTQIQLRTRLADRFDAFMDARDESDVNAARAEQAISNVVRRAFNVAWALRGPVLTRRNARNRLGWIAVSGEDDRPHRPVNVASADFPQRDVAVSVNGHDMVLRVVFMNPRLVDGDWSVRVDRSRLPEPQPIPQLTGDVVIFLHGNASSAEEASSLAPRIFEEANRRGRELTVLSLDLPGYGYGTTLDTSRFTNLPLDTVPNTYEGLGLLEAALDGLVMALDREQPGFKERIVGVIGGSLGGNLGLRLAGRDPGGLSYPWNRNIVSWSPASVWPSFADDCDDRLGTDGCFTAGLVADYAQRKLAVATTHDNVSDRFHEGKRRNFYSGMKTQRDSQFSIAGKWYRDGFACKDAYIEDGKWLTGEYFSEGYSPWHWRIVNEQLVFSQWDAPRPLMQRHRSYPKLLLIVGEDDNAKPEYLYDNAVRLGGAMTRNYGRTIDLAETGHSAHAERPVFLARQIVDFIYETPPAAVVVIAQ